MAIRATRSGSSRSSSNIFASLANSLLSATAAKQDADYADAQITDEDYLAMLRSRKANATSPLQAQNIDTSIGDLQEKIARTRLNAQVESGQKSFFDLASFEKNLLDSKNPGSLSYLTQQNRYNTVRDQAADAARKIVNQQIQNGQASASDLANLESSFLPLYKEDGEQSASYQAQVFRTQDAQRTAQKNEFNSVKSLEDARINAGMARASASGNYTQFSQLARQKIEALQKRVQDNPWVYYDAQGNPTDDFYRAEQQVQTLTNSIATNNLAAITASERAAKDGYKADRDPILNNKRIIQAQIDKLNQGIVTEVDDKGKIVDVKRLSELDGAAFNTEKEKLLQKQLDENNSLAEIYQYYSPVIDTGQELFSLQDENNKIQQDLDQNITPFKQNLPNTIDVWDGTKFVPQSVNATNLDNITQTYGNPAQGQQGILGSANVKDANGNDRRILISNNSKVKPLNIANGQVAGLDAGQIVRVGDSVLYRPQGGGDFTPIDEKTFSQLVLNDKDQTVLKELGYSPDQATQLYQTASAPAPTVQAPIIPGAPGAGFGGASSILQQTDAAQQAKAEADRKAAEEAARLQAQQAQQLATADAAKLTVANAAPPPPLTVTSSLPKKPLTVTSKVASPKLTVATKAPLKPLASNPTITSAPLGMVGQYSPTGLQMFGGGEISADDFFKKHDQSATGLINQVGSFLGGGYSYQFKQNPDKTFGVDFFQGSNPITNEVFSQKTGKSFDSVQGELNDLLKNNPALVKSLGGK